MLNRTYEGLLTLHIHLSDRFWTLSPTGLAPRIGMFGSVGRLGLKSSNSGFTVLSNSIGSIL